MFQGSLTVEESKRIRQMCLSKPRYFKKVKLSVTAASKMLNHASAGQPYEVLGLLQGSYNE